MLRVFGLLAIFALGGVASFVIDKYVEEQDTLIKHLREDVEQTEGLCR